MLRPPGRSRPASTPSTADGARRDRRLVPASRFMPHCWRRCPARRSRRRTFGPSSGARVVGRDPQSRAERVAAMGLRRWRRAVPEHAKEPGSPPGRCHCRRLSGRSCPCRRCRHHGERDNRGDRRHGARPDPYANAGRNDALRGAHTGHEPATAGFARRPGRTLVPSALPSPCPAVPGEQRARPDITTPGQLVPALLLG